MLHARISRIVVVLGLMAAVSLPVPAQAAPVSVSLVTAPKKIVLDGKTYRVRLHADRFTFGGEAIETIALSISQVMDPAGDGPLHARRYRADG